MSEQDAKKNIITTPPFTSASVPEIAIDHVAGLTEAHGIVRILCLKHRPHLTTIDGKVTVGDMLTESCVLSCGQASIKSIADKLNEYLSSIEEEQK